MRTLSFAILLVAASALAQTKPDDDPWAGRTDLIAAPELKPTTKVSLGALSRSTLPNGTLLVVVPRHQVPSVGVTLAIRLPSTAEPIDKVGIAEFVATMLRRGTTTRSADEIAEAIDMVGGALGADAAGGALRIGCHARARDLSLCLSLVSDLAMHATFPEAELDEARDELLSTVNGVKDNPQALAHWHVENVFYGDDDARGRPMSKRSLEAIGRDDLVAFHARWFAPNNAILAVSGDVDDKAVRAEIRKTFGAWPKREVPPILDPPPKPLDAAKPMALRFVDKPDATQTVLDLIGPGIRHADRQFYAVTLMNYVLGGGGFSSRLMKVVRAEGGKTYGVHSGFAAGREAGPFIVSTFTRSSETVATLDLMNKELDKMRAAGPTEKELKEAKSHLIGGYGLRLETGGDLCEALVRAEIDGLDQRYVAEYPARLQAVTQKDAAEAARQHLDARALVALGKVSEVGPMLKKAGYGKLEVVNYLEPISAAERKAARAEQSAKSEPTAAETMEGRRLLALALKARGGQAALEKVSTLLATGKGAIERGGQKTPIRVELKSIRGKAVREDIDLNGVLVKQLIIDGGGYLQQGDRRLELPPEMLKVLFRDPNFVALNALLPRAKVRGKPGTTLDNVSYDAVEVISPDGDLYKLYFDPKTHYLVRMRYLIDGRAVIDELSDYRVVDGVAFPFKLMHYADQKIELVYDKIAVNPKLAPETFR